MQEMLTPSDVAKRLNVTTATLRQWRMQGGGPPYLDLADKTIRYPESELSRWVESRKGHDRYENLSE